MTDAIVEIAGESLSLLPERAIFWKRRSTLFVADLHFGKASSFRALGVPVPRGTTTGTLDRLDGILRRTGANRLVFLGDFLHAAEGRGAETLRVLNEWRRRHAAVEMTLVRGNHDARAGDPPKELEIRCDTAPVLDGPFVLDHHPRRSDHGYVLCGHIHPAVTLSGSARQHSRVACFWLGREIGVLPAFGEFTGFGEADVQPGDRVFAVADDAVIEVPVVQAGTHRSKPG
jgi:DNA ligase-associated metallophosphoesterase